MTNLEAPPGGKAQSSPYELSRTPCTGARRKSTWALKGPMTCCVKDADKVSGSSVSFPAGVTTTCNAQNANQRTIYSFLSLKKGRKRFCLKSL